jgi:hypothetical protein
LTHFPELLGVLQQKLVLPQPARSRVLLEIADDLEGLYQHYKNAGLDDEAARRRTVEGMDLAPEVLTDLIEIHTSPYERFLDGLSERARSRWERGLLVALSAFVCFLLALAVRAGPVFSQANAFIWPVLVCLGIGIVLSLERVYVLFLRKVYRAREARRGLSVLLSMSAAQIALGIAGIWLDLFRVSKAASSDPSRLGGMGMEWMIGGTALMLVSVGGAIVLAMWWFVLASRAAAIEEEEALALLEISGAREENKSC